MKRFRGLSRREFLKLISLIPLGMYSRPLRKVDGSITDANVKNVILIVFDAWSQQHVSLYGYPRPTMPNLEAFARTGTVYHNHYSTATFTVPGTSSILTGMYPWSHRAFQLGAGIAPAHAGHTIFSALSPSHASMAYSQNKYADMIIQLSEADLDQHADYWSFNIEHTNMFGAPLLKKNYPISFASLEDNLVQKGEGTDSSLFLGLLLRLNTLHARRVDGALYGKEYPRGLPDATELFLLPDVVDGAIGLLKNIQQPTFVYFHFYPPHEPYTPTEEFFGSFNDGVKVDEKPTHELSDTKYRSDKLRLERQYYDEFLASWDAEVARLFQFLEDSGLKENSHIFITSDHGDLFERGELGHWTKTIFDPVIHVPLIVLSAGQTNRRDVYVNTSSVDLLPTIAHLTGNPIPEWVEGFPLPELGGTADEIRSVFSMDAKMNSSFGPLIKNYSMSLTRDRYRLTCYRYPRDQYEKFEFYGLEADPQELKDLFPSSPSLAAEMMDELLQKVSDVNRKFIKDGQQ